MGNKQSNGEQRRFSFSASATNDTEYSKDDSKDTPNNDLILSQTNGGSNTSNSGSNNGSPNKRSTFKFGFQGFRSNNEHLVNPTFGNGVQIMCQNPNLLSLPPGIEHNNTVITSVNRSQLLSFGYFRMNGINPTDIATILSKYIDCYTEVYFQFNKEKMKYHKARLMLVFKPEITLLTSNYLNNLLKKSMKIRIKMIENDCFYSWYKHNGYDIECGVIGIPKDDTSLNKFSKRFQKLKYDFISFSQIHTKHSSFKYLQCYYLSCVRHSDANLTTCRVEMRGPNLIPNSSNSGGISSGAAAAGGGGGDDVKDDSGISGINNDLGGSDNDITTGGIGGMAGGMTRAKSDSSVGSVDMISNNNNNSEDVKKDDSNNGSTTSNTGRRDSKSNLKKKFKKNDSKNDEMMSESVIIYNRYKRSLRDNNPNVNEDYFWKVGDSIDICIDYEEDNDKYFLYFLKNDQHGSKLIDKQSKKQKHQNNNNNNTNNPNNTNNRKNTNNNNNNNNNNNGSNFNSIESDTTEEHKDPTIQAPNSPGAGYKDRLYYYRRHSSVGDLKQLNIDDLMLNNDENGNDGGISDMNSNGCNNGKSAFDNGRIELNCKDYYYYAAITTVGCDCDDMKGFEWSISLSEQENSPFMKKKKEKDDIEF